MPCDLVFTTRVRVTDEARLREALCERALPLLAQAPLPLNLAYALLVPSAPPCERGYTLLASGAIAVSDRPGEYDLTVVVRVSQRRRFVEEARHGYHAHWGDADWWPGTLAEAAYEILLASNANPSPSELGVALVGTQFGDSPAVTPAT